MNEQREKVRRLRATLAFAKSGNGNTANLEWGLRQAEKELARMEHLAATT